MTSEDNYNLHYLTLALPEWDADYVLWSVEYVGIVMSAHLAAANSSQQQPLYQATEGISTSTLRRYIINIIYMYMNIIIIIFLSLFNTLNRRFSASAKVVPFAAKLLCNSSSLPAMAAMAETASVCGCG